MGTFTFDTAGVLTQAVEILTILSPLIILTLGIKYGGRLVSLFKRG